MESPHFKQRQHFTETLESITGDLKKATATTVSADNLQAIQERLDQLARQYQHDETIGVARYKLYELQALVYYFGRKDEQALEFIGYAIEVHGSSYPKAEKLRETIQANAAQAQKGVVLFFHKSPVTVFWLSFLTLNIYNVYWSYKHWRAIRLSTGERTFPILSAIFQLFTTHSLFKRISNAGNGHAYSLRNPGWLATAYIVVLLVSNFMSRVETKMIDYGIPSQSQDIAAAIATVVLCLIIAFISAVAQKAANAHDEAVMGAGHAFRKIYPGEIIFSVIGVSLFIMAFYMYGNDIITNQYPRGTQAEIAALGEKVTALEEEYDDCSASLDERYEALDTEDESAVDEYNEDADSCEDVRLEFNKAVDEYNWLAGFED